MRKPANHPPDVSLRHGLPFQPTDPSAVAAAAPAAALPPPCSSTSPPGGVPCCRGSSAVGVQLPSCGSIYIYMLHIMYIEGIEYVL